MPPYFMPNPDKFRPLHALFSPNASAYPAFFSHTDDAEREQDFERTRRRVSIRMRSLGFWRILVVLFRIIAFAVLLFSCKQGGVSSRYQPKENDAFLSQQARKALPLISAINQYKSRTGELPSSVEMLENTEFLESGVTYIIDDYQHYRIIIRLGWDPSLVYISKEQKWFFDPGDGKEMKSIVLE